MHYTGTKKPWEYPDMALADCFWKEVKDTEIAFEILDDEFRKKAEKYNEMQCFNRYRFPYEQIPPGAKIAIYGAGDVGKAFYKQLAQTRYADVVLWVDENYININNKEVKSIESLEEWEGVYNYVVVAIEKEEIASVVIKVLKGMNIYMDKIVWRSYC